MKTQQEIFDTVSRHLLTQRAKAKDETGCVYLAPDGKKCAVGILIPDGHPAQHFEGSVRALLTNFPDLRAEFGHARELLMYVQSTHDIEIVRDWPAALRRDANKFNLSAAVVDEIEAKQ